MKKIIKKWGNSLVIRLDPEDIELMGVSEGDVIEIHQFNIIKKEVKKK